MADLKLRAIISVADRATAPLKNINRQLGRIQAPFRNLGRQLKALDRNSGFRRLRQSFGRVAGQAAVATGAIGGVVAAVLGFTNKFAQNADSIGKTAAKIGIGVESYQELAFAADRSGVSGETFASSLTALSKRLGEAKAGSGALASLLKRVSPELLKQLQATDNLESAFNLLVGAMGRLDDPAKRAALAAAAFSRAGIGMANLAKEGATGVDALRKRARELGLVLDAETVAAAEKFQDSLTDAKGVMSGLFSVIGSKLLPTIEPLINQFTAWAIANKDLIATKITKFVEDLSENFNKFTSFLSDNEGTIKKVWDAIGGMRGALIGLGVVVASPLLAALAGVLVAALSPAGLIAGALIAAGAAGFFLTKKIEELGQVVRPMMREFSTWFGASFNKTLDAFGAFGDAVQGFFVDLWGWMISKATEAFGKLIKTIAGFAKQIGSLLSGPLNAVREFFGGGDVSINRNETVTQTNADPDSALIRPLQPSLPRQSAQTRPNLLSKAHQANQQNQAGMIARALKQSQSNSRIELKIDSDKPVRTTKLFSDGPILDVDSGLRLAP